MTISATLPVDQIDAANAALAELGHGPSNFSVPLRTGTDAATHAGLHSWDDAAFLAALQSLTIPGLVIRDEPGQTVNFEAHVQQQALEWSDPTLWFQNPVMTGDEKTRDGKLWRSRYDYNVWAPPIGWDLVVTEGYETWTERDSTNGYMEGKIVEYKGDNYMSNIDNNVWSPEAYPAGWTKL